MKQPEFTCKLCDATMRSITSNPSFMNNGRPCYVYRCVCKEYWLHTWEDESVFSEFITIDYGNFPSWLLEWKPGKMSEISTDNGQERSLLKEAWIEELTPEIAKQWAEKLRGYRVFQ